MKSYQFVNKLITGKPSYLDIIFYFLTLVLCYFCFNHGDILVINSWSFTYLYGHIKDFYEVNKDILGVCNYFPSTSILFAIWNIPLRLLRLGGVAAAPGGYFIFWYKLLPALFLAGSAYFMYKIGKSAGLSDSNSRLLTIIWVSMPVLFFSQFIFGQADIFTAFFVLVGLYCLLQKRVALFALLFGISFTFKYFPFLIFIPLLLLIEKNPGKLIGYLALSALPAGLEALFYANSPIFKTEILGETMLGWTFHASLNIFPGVVNIYLFLLIWFIICGMCYYVDPFKRNYSFYQISIYTCLAVSCVFFILVFWHPQWLLFMTPFLAMTTLMSKRIRYFLLFDFLLMAAFVGFTVCVYQMNVDQTMMIHGILGNFNPALGDQEKAFRMAKLFTLGINRPDEIRNIYYTLFSAILVLNVLFKFPNRGDSWENGDELVPVEEYWNYARLSFFGGVAIFVIPAFIAYLLTLLGT